MQLTAGGNASIESEDRKRINIDASLVKVLKRLRYLKVVVAREVKAHPVYSYRAIS